MGYNLDLGGVLTRDLHALRSAEKKMTVLVLQTMTVEEMLSEQTQWSKQLVRTTYLPAPAKSVVVEIQ